MLTPTRRWFQFRLRTLLLLTAAVAVGLSVLLANQGLRQRKALASLRARGLDRYVVTEPTGPHWLRKLVGEDRFLKVRQFTFPNRDYGDGDLAVLEGLSYLRWLQLSETRVTDAGLVHLQGLHELKYLGLARTGITDAGLEQLAGLTSLETLDLRVAELTDAGLEHLQRLTRLRSLNLQDTQVTGSGLVHLKGATDLREFFAGFRALRGDKSWPRRMSPFGDDGLEHLAGMTKLEKLELYATSVSDAGLRYLRRMSMLRQLELRGTDITDAGLVHLSGLKSLETLYLPRGITDAGLEHLKGLAGLRQLILWRSKVSDAAVKRFKEALPGVDVR